MWGRLIAEGGGHGVQLFFVISAFSLTVRAVQRPDGTWGAYALRRIARVGPAFWLAGIGYTLAKGLGPEPTLAAVKPLDLMIAAVFGSAWQGGNALPIVTGGWSVSCEVAFYAALPVLITIINGSLLRSVLLTLVVGLVAYQLSAYHAMDGVWNVRDYVHPAEQAPAFMLGVTAAYVAMHKRLPDIPGACLVLLVTAIVGLPLLQVIPPHLPFAAIVAVVVALAATHPPAILTSLPMRRLGEVCYSMYLLHFVVLSPSLSLALWLMPQADWRTALIHMVIPTGISYPLARIMYQCIERPAIQWAAGAARRSSPVPA
jgi:peptidoglycan/LPS O-acetylase OafA/YrhL